MAHLQKERDCYAEQIQEEGRVWKDKTEQLLTQVGYAVASVRSLVLTSFFDLFCLLYLYRCLWWQKKGTETSAEFKNWRLPSRS